jgi:hypothetical protein
MWRRLDEARAIKLRLDAGTAYPWEARRLESLVREARLYGRIARDLTPRRPPSQDGLSYRTLTITRNIDL